MAHVSRSTIETESHYAQIEKEMLATLFAVERFGQYVYGSFFLPSFLSSFVFVPFADLSSRLYQFGLGVRVLLSKRFCNSVRL